GASRSPNLLQCNVTWPSLVGVRAHLLGNPAFPQAVLGEPGVGTPDRARYDRRFARNHKAIPPTDIKAAPRNIRYPGRCLPARRPVAVRSGVSAHVARLR